MVNDTLETVSQNTEDVKSPRKNSITILIKIVVVIICCCVLYKMWLLIDEKKNYSIETLYDVQDNNIKVIDFPIKDKWKPFGKVTVNKSSVPNLKTFYVAVVNPKERAEIQFFSTQFETDIKETKTFGKNEDISSDTTTDTVSDNKVAEDYMLSVLKKMNPKAENITIVKNYVKSDEKNDIKYKTQKDFLSSAYSNMNPATEKSKSSLENIKAVPVSILFSFYENGYHYYQRFDCDFMTFKQVFEETMKTKKIKQEIQYTKCADVFSYKVLAKYYKKNLREFNVFKKYIKINKDWVDMTNEERRELIHLKNYSTTQTIMAGDKFKPDSLKNLIYVIEYMSDNDKMLLADSLNIKLKNFTKI